MIQLSLVQIVITYGLNYRQHSANLLVAKIPIFYIIILTTKAKHTELVYYVVCVFGHPDIENNYIKS